MILAACLQDEEPGRSLEDGSFESDDLRKVGHVEFPAKGRSRIDWAVPCRAHDNQPSDRTLTMYLFANEGAATPAGPPICFMYILHDGLSARPLLPTVQLGQLEDPMLQTRLNRPRS